jgi:hypothetical protein
VTGLLGERLKALRGLSRTLDSGALAEELQLPTYQIQLFVESFTPLTPAEQKQAQAFYQYVYRTLSKVGAVAQEKQP